VSAYVSVCVSVCLSVWKLYCGKVADWIWMTSVIGPEWHLTISYKCRLLMADISEQLISTDPADDWRSRMEYVLFWNGMSVIGQVLLGMLDDHQLTQ